MCVCERERMAFRGRNHKSLSLQKRTSDVFFRSRVHHQGLVVREAPDDGGVVVVVHAVDRAAVQVDGRGPGGGNVAAGERLEAPRQPAGKGRQEIINRFWRVKNNQNVVWNRLFVLLAHLFLCT